MPPKALESMAFSRKRIFILLAGALAVIALIFTINYSVCSRGESVRPRPGPIVEAVYALGTVKSDNVFNLKIGISTTVKKLAVVEGQTVRRGDLLLVTDTGPAFTAPFSGTVTRIYCEEGEVVMTGSPLLTLMDLSRRYVQVSLDQNSALRVKKNQKAELSVETIRGNKLTGTVESIYPSGGQFLARINVAKMPSEILPDMTADVAIEIERKENALLIPLSAVREGIVTVKRNGSLRRIKTRIGAIDGAWGEVLDGSILPSDEIVLVK